MNKQQPLGKNQKKKFFFETAAQIFTPKKCKSLVQKQLLVKIKLKIMLYFEETDQKDRNYGAFLLDVAANNASSA